MAFTANAGVEDLTLSGADDGALWFGNAVNSWAYRVECTVWLGHGCIQVNGSFRVQLEQFYVHDGAWPEPGGGGYAIALCCGSTEILIWNGISLRADKVMVSFQSGAGSVTAYNYMDQAFICCNSSHPANGNDSWIENGLNNAHYPGSHHMLFEGNFTHQMGEDETHGNSIYNTYFRNYSTGLSHPILDQCLRWSNDKRPDRIAARQAWSVDSGGDATLHLLGVLRWQRAWVSRLQHQRKRLGLEQPRAALRSSSLGAGYTSGNNGPDPKAGFDTNGVGGTTRHTATTIT